MDSSNRIRIGPLELDLNRKALFYGEKDYHIEDRHCCVLERLADDMEYEGAVVTKTALLRTLKRAKTSGGTDLKSIVSEIRKAIRMLTGCDLVKIINVSGKGYYLKTDYLFSATQDTEVAHSTTIASRVARSHLAAPAEDALAFATAFNARAKRIVGNVIEAYPHPFLGNKQSLAHIGWSPSDIVLRLKNGLFDVSDISSDQAIRAAFEAS